MGLGQEGGAREFPARVDGLGIIFSGRIQERERLRRKGEGAAIIAERCP